METISVFEEPLFKCDVYELEFNRDAVIKIEYGPENYTVCRKCFKALREV